MCPCSHKYIEPWVLNYFMSLSLLQSTQTDMFSVFLLKRRLKQRDHFNIVADHIKRQDRRSDDFTLEGAPFGPNRYFIHM